MWRRNHPVVQMAFLEDLRSRDSALPDRVIGMALASRDVVFVSGISDVKLGSEHTDVVEAIDELSRLYPGLGQYLLPVDPKRDPDVYCCAG
jgi:hypothetical protein